MPATEQIVARSEGLAIASLRMFEAGAFSSDPADPLRADAARLINLSHEEVANGFQSMVGNRLVGVEGRADLLAALGKAAESQSGGVCARGSRAARRAVTIILPRSPRMAAFRRRASSKRCSNISARSGQAG